ncbi:hypothetical protein CC1G_11214 [Coprinopsis cinerea okayama7|uniref:Uncharacterized protein n=1 Tax=Coprinopsis cinerea (strain Okayama-7 / 130 / ATCC MYA-4618 / FGSC 9003) TaxID=240176 RepID=A8NJV0_COPC7|nr:hypothetical protein CC1G_11214 [Coprinopsis cinerea okayama7\|eukprot:XP_001834301.2 hypothetical protein CC1G_11214 [Coprinopsis cinerea okayama7\
MILDDKTIMALPPPPPYLPSNNPFSHPTPGAQSPANPPPSFSEALNSPTCSHTPGRALKLSSLPPHILPAVVYNTFPTHPLIDTLLAFYIACMHVLRSTYLPAYTSLLRPYYSSDPFPSTPVPQAHGSTLNTVQRETPILDQFIALKVREDVFADDSELHLEREDMFKDIFDHSQPKARLEDLVRIYGVKEGVVTLAPPGVVTYTSTSTSSSSSKDTVMPARPNMPPPSPGGSTGRSSTSRFFSAFMRSSSSRSKSKSPSPPPTARQSATTKRKIRPVPFALLSVTFSTRKVGLQLMSTETGAKRTIVEVQRMSRDENLEAAASRIVAELKGLLLS